jgi:hypothetical protein
MLMFNIIAIRLVISGDEGKLIYNTTWLGFSLMLEMGG